MGAVNITTFNIITTAIKSIFATSALSLALPMSSVWAMPLPELVINLSASVAHLLRLFSVI